MPHWWNQRITLYKKTTSKIDEKTIVSWNKSWHNNCFYGETKKQILNGTTIQYLSQVFARIPGNIVLSQGDIIVKGTINDELDEYVAGFRSNDLLNKYKGNCFIVNTAKDNTKLKTAHWFGGSL